MYVAQAGRNAGSFGAGEQRLNFVISAVNMATPGIAAVSAGFANLTAIGMRTSSALTEAMSPLAGGLLAVGGASALALGYATVQAAQFEQQMKYVQAVSDSSNADIMRMSESVKNLSMQYGMSATEIAQGMQTLGRAGIKDATAQVEIYTDALKMAKIEGMDLTTAIEGIITQTSMFGATMDNPAEFAKSAEQITKDLVHASQISPTSVEQLLMGAKYVGGTAATAGWGSQELYGTLAYMASKGVTGEVAGTAMRGFLTKTTMEQPQFLEALGKLGLGVEDLWPGGEKALDPVAMFSLIQSRMQKFSKQEQIGLWAQLAQQKTSQQLLKIKPEELQDYLNKMKEQFDLDQKVAIAMDSAMEQFNRLKATIEVLFINLGDGFVKFIRPAIEGLQSLLKSLAENQAAVTAFAFLLSGAVVGALAVVGRWAASIGGYILESFQFWGTSASNLGSRLVGFSGTADMALVAQQNIQKEAALAAQAFNAEALSVDRANAAYGRMVATEATLGAIPMQGRMGGRVPGSTGAWSQKEWLAAAGSQTGIHPGFHSVNNRNLSDLERIELMNTHLDDAMSRNASELASIERRSTFKNIGKEEAEYLAERRKVLTEEIAQMSTISAGYRGGSIVDVDYAKNAPLSKTAQIKKLFSVAPENSLLVRAGLVSIGEGAEAGATGISALALSMTTLIPVLIIGGALIATAYYLWKRHTDAVEKANKTLKASQEEYKTQAQKVDELRTKMINASGEYKAKLTVDLSQAETALETYRKNVRTNFQQTVNVQSVVEQDIARVASKGPSAFAYNSYFLEEKNKIPGGVDENQALYGYRTMQKGWEPLKKYAAQIDYINKNFADSDPNKARLLAEAQEKLSNQTGWNATETKTYTSALLKNWQMQQLTTRMEANETKIRNLQWNLLLAHMGLLSGSSQDLANAAGTSDEAIKGQVSTQDKLNNAADRAIDTQMRQIYAQEKAIDSLNKQIDYFIKLSQLALDPLNAQKQKSVDDAKAAMNNQIFPDYETWKKQNQFLGMADTAQWLGEDIPGFSATDKYGAGTSGTGTSGTGTGGKGKVAAPYNIDFVICSQKTLPPLDPNLFKRKPVIDLTQKTFQVDNIHINTRDKPEVIESTLTRSIVSIANSDRVNPTVKDSTTVGT